MIDLGDHEKTINSDTFIEELKRSFMSELNRIESNKGDLARANLFDGPSREPIKISSLSISIDGSSTSDLHLASHIGSSIGSSLYNSLTANLSPLSLTREI